MPPARKLPEGLRERSELHISEAFELYGTLALLATAEGDEREAKMCMDLIRPLSDDEHDLRLYHSWEGRVAKVRRMRAEANGD